MPFGDLYYPAAVRLYRSNGTEITIPGTRFPWNSANWTMIPTGDVDDNGDPIPAAWVNGVVVAFPAPALLDLASVMTTARLYRDVGGGILVAQSGNILLLNFLTQLLGAQYVVFSPGQLTMTMQYP